MAGSFPRLNPQGVKRTDLPSSVRRIICEGAMTIEMKLFDDLAPSMREAQAFPKMRYRGAWPRTPHTRSRHWPTSTDNGLIQFTRVSAIPYNWISEQKVRLKALRA